MVFLSPPNSNGLPVCAFQARTNPPLTRALVAFKMCSQRHIKQRAQPSGAPPTARPSKCTISSVTRAWSGMTTLKPRQRSTAHVLEHAQTHHGIPLHTKDARNSTSDSARNSRVRHPARPSKCTISSTVRARSGTPTHIIIYIYYIKNDICLLSFIMIFMIKILMLVNIY